MLSLLESVQWFFFVASGLFFTIFIFPYRFFVIFTIIITIKVSFYDVSFFIYIVVVSILSIFIFFILSIRSMRCSARTC